MTEKLLAIANEFVLEGTISEITPLGQGFINDTFIIHTEGEAPNYILQRKNKAIFPDVPAMMDNIDRVTAHIRAKVAAEGGNIKREVMTINHTHDGKFYHIDEAGEYWAVCEFIADTVAYDSANSEALARMGGMGIGKFQSQLADFTEPLAEVIKGFHNIKHRFVQWDEAIAQDAVGRVASLSEEISWIESRREEMLAFWAKVESGEIPMRVTHNDTKINNILFDKQGNVLCVIDLDTVMSAPALNDFGDAIRTYANTGAEDATDLSTVSLSLPMFAAYADGYLSQQAKTLTQAELDHLAFSARYITFEQVLRFLMDYINGDTYYKIKSPLHNLERTHAQYALLQSIEAQYEAMCEVIKTTTAKYLA